MATITPVAVPAGGAAVPKSAASVGGDSIHNCTATTKLLVLNGGGGSITVTFVGVINCSHGNTHSTAVPVPAGQDWQIPVPPDCIDPATGFCAVTYSGVTTVTVAATA